MLSQNLRVALAQLNMLVGDVQGNCQRTMEAAARAAADGADVVVFPELNLTGYPPEDLLLRGDLLRQVDAAIDTLKAHSQEICMVVGAPRKVDGRLYNCAIVLQDGALRACYKKQELPNYAVFDEQRYFTAGDQPCVLEFNGFKVGMNVCEDVWYEGPVEQARQAGAELIFHLNASPFNQGKLEEREQVLRQRVTESGLPVVYVNLVGGQDELVFDGASFVMDARGEVVQRSLSFEEALDITEIQRRDGQLHIAAGRVCAPLQNDAAAYHALVLGVRDYVTKNGFTGVVIGLSGGIDSAVTLAVAADALGAQNVEAVMLPSRYTADMSLEDAQKMARTLDIEYRVIPIEKAFKAFMELLADEFADERTDVTEENIQARCRGVILMAISNKKGRMVLSTGNKSEMAVGYSTLYGDMAGGLDVLKDVPKLLVYRLARYINRRGEIVPPRIIERPPSAELAPGQKDTDSLPDYAVLDPIVQFYVEQDKSEDEIVALGYDRETVDRVVRMIDRNEYKRRQGPPGIRITSRAFGKDRRYPITSGFRD